MRVIGGIIVFLLFIGCGNPNDRELKYVPSDSTTRKPQSKQSNQSKQNTNNTRMTEQQCAINMSKLVLLAQEAERHGGIIRIDDDVDCPTDRQLKETRIAIDQHKQNIYNQRVQQAQEEAEQQEARLRAQANRDVIRRTTILRVGDKCYKCPQDTSPEECSSRKGELTPYDC